MFIRTEFNYDIFQASIDSGLKCEDASLAKDSFREECDINTIVRRFGLTGQLPKDVRAPVYGDYDTVSDYHSAMNAISSANSAFMEMPAHIRARFENDAGKFVAFCSDDKNREEAVKLGLVFPAAADVVGSPAAGQAAAPAAAGAAPAAAAA